MSTENQTVLAGLPAPIIGKFNISLTQSKFQQFADKAHSLVINEDNLSDIKEFLKTGREIEKGIESVHKSGKEDALQICRDWDTAKRAFIAQVVAITSSVQQRYEVLCKDIAEREAKQLAEELRKKQIKDGIDSNAIAFAMEIAGCKTLKELTDVESRINLEKTRKTKYMEFTDEASARFTELNAHIKTQKEIVKELEKNAAATASALKKGDDEQLMQLQEQQELIMQKAEESNTLVQEAAINQSTSAAPIEVKTTFPSVTARRTTWKFEMVDQKEVMKKAPELLVVSLDDAKVKSILSTLKDSGTLAGKTEITVNGIRYFESKTF